MENKYYTPTIEEFRVGFEYEQVSINPQEDITVSYEDNTQYFQGTIKNKSELITLLKQLNIF